MNLELCEEKEGILMGKELEEILKKTESEKILLLSIKPEFNKMILNGEKTIELRKRLPKNISELIFVYESSPTKQITSVFKVKKNYLENIQSMKRFIKKARVSKTFFENYYQGKKVGVAFEIEKAYKLEKNIPLKTLKTHKITAPQDYCYLPKKLIALMLQE